MVAVRDIITHVGIETAARARICHHNRRQHEVTSGQMCLVIQEHGGGRKNYCLACAKEILAKAKNKLLVLEQQLQNGNSSQADLENADALLLAHEQ